MAGKIFRGGVEYGAGGSHSVDGVLYINVGNQSYMPVEGAVNLPDFNALIADEYDSTATYAQGDYCIYSGKLYKCTTAVITAEAFDPEKWTTTTIMAEIEGR